jgi:hypothetical protein
MQWLRLGCAVLIPILAACRGDDGAGIYESGMELGTADEVGDSDELETGLIPDFGDASEAGGDD